ncbi:hypothetical protein MARCHEWKA_00540 [Brevundimonas phage vB_BpoS-Marchewka]|uniref:Uncharacterized protein n=1 Tax=Brevundimonas phage vB_BpoS-Marchewka TaxID=2948604 RepID=A0A9E7STP6_9CAUD|nr:hypothetical protein MARCHEWKA_00540 [Brevundimonas phage vB_BpoS-Marchewka]
MLDCNNWLYNPWFTWTLGVAFGALSSWLITAHYARQASNELRAEIARVNTDPGDITAIFEAGVEVHNEDEITC